MKQGPPEEDYSLGPCGAVQKFFVTIVCREVRKHFNRESSVGFKRIKPFAYLTLAWHQLDIKFVILHDYSLEGMQLSNLPHSHCTDLLLSAMNKWHLNFLFLVKFSLSLSLTVPPPFV